MTKHLRDQKGMAGTSDKAASEKPGWADGLKKLYESVVEEPLPDSFDDLLKRLDERKNGK